jgi:hypothetical protein
LYQRQLQRNSIAGIFGGKPLDVRGFEGHPDREDCLLTFVVVLEGGGAVEVIVGKIESQAEQFINRRWRKARGNQV